MEGEISMSDYIKYRGKCKEMSEQYIKEHPGCILTKGWYYCPYIGAQQHWWVKDSDGNIIDPTKNQFPSKGNGIYEEYNGTMPCECCGKLVKEEDIYFVEHHTYCSETCYARDVGF